MQKRLQRKRENSTMKMEIPELPFISKDDLANARWDVLYKEIGETGKTADFLNGLRNKFNVSKSFDLDTVLKYVSHKCKEGIGVDENGKLYVR